MSQRCVVVLVKRGVVEKLEGGAGLSQARPNPATHIRKVRSSSFTRILDSCTNPQQHLQQHTSRQSTHRRQLSKSYKPENS